MLKLCLGIYPYPPLAPASIQAVGSNYEFSIPTFMHSLSQIVSTSPNLCSAKLDSPVKAKNAMFVEMQW